MEPKYSHYKAVKGWRESLLRFLDKMPFDPVKIQSPFDIKQKFNPNFPDQFSVVSGAFHKWFAIIVEAKKGEMELVQMLHEFPLLYNLLLFSDEISYPPFEEIVLVKHRAHFKSLESNLKVILKSIIERISWTTQLVNNGMISYVKQIKPEQLEENLKKMMEGNKEGAQASPQKEEGVGQENMLKQLMMLSNLNLVSPQNQ